MQCHSLRANISCNRPWLGGKSQGCRSQLTFGGSGHRKKDPMTKATKACDTKVTHEPTCEPKTGLRRKGSEEKLGK